MPYRFRPHERLAPGELPPSPVAWLHPLELLRTGYHALLSQVATSYLDRREMLAALDREPPDSDQAPPILSTNPLDGDIAFVSEEHRKAGVWVDFVADIGDSWEATYSVATLMAQRTLRVAGYAGDLPHADLLVLGGDLVYPSPTRDGYRRRTRGPIGSAFPQSEVAPEKEPDGLIRPRRLVAIPGNHDWYDGLTSFVREFCQGAWLGGWQMTQARSYFAVKLMRHWWIFGIDIALDTRIDPAQQEYFIDVLANRDPSKHRPFERGDNVILCTAKPSWLRSSRYSEDAYKNLEFFVRDLIEPHGGHVAMMLSGDLHHYARYADGDSHQLITCGGGGAYLMGTHHLPPQVQPFRRRVAGPDDESPWTSEAFVRGGFSYPSYTDSRRLALGALLLAFRRANVAFCVTVGLVALWISIMLDRVAPWLVERRGASSFATEAPWRLDALAIATAVVIVGGCAWFAAGANRNAKRWLTVPWGALHGALQVATAVLLALLMPHALEAIGGPTFPYITLSGDYSEVGRQLSRIADAVVFTLIAGWIGASLAGIYLLASDFLWRWHHNEVFAAQSICDYRSFIRIHIGVGNRFTIYPIGLRRVPHLWRSRLDGSPSDPHYEPTDAELLPHLIEGPIAVEVSETGWPTAGAGAAAAPVNNNLEMTG